MRTLLALLFICTSAVGQTQSPIKSATVNDLVDKLAPTEEAARTRSWNTRNLVPQAKSVDLVIQFALDSSRLEDSNLPLLDNLAAAMKSDRLTNTNFKVEGHTDSQGSASYNLKLSQSRAEAVMNYLITQGIDKSRLSVEGKGFAELLVPDKPNSPENRRVKITAM